MPTDPTSQLNYEAYGPEDSSTIVFLHGGGAGGWMWREQVKFFQSEYRCLVPDLPEQGRNAGQASCCYSTEGAAEQVIQFINNLSDRKKTNIVGLSEGAQVVVSILSKSPEIVDHAVVSSAILHPVWFNRFFTPWLIRLSYRMFMAPLKTSDWWIRLNMRESAGITEDYYEDFRRGFQTTTESGLANMMLAALNFRMPSGLDKANCPVLVVVGSKEYKQMRQSAQDLLQVLPSARGVVVSLGSKLTLAQEHNWAITAPDLFNSTVKAWIEDQPLPASLLPL